MINQITVNNGYSATYTVSAEPTSATVSLIDTTGTTVVSNQTATITATVISYEFTNTLFTIIGTYTLVWSVVIDGETLQYRDYVDVDYVNRTRYCYQNEITRKLVDITLPNDFDLGSYSARASSEIDRALQGLYALPLAPTSDMDKYSLRELSSDIAAGYALEDLTVLADNRSNYYTNNLKTVGFAELNRYVRGEKEFTSITKNTTKEGLHYQYGKPRVVGFRDLSTSSGDLKDPMNRFYDGTQVRDNV